MDTDVQRAVVNQQFNTDKMLSLDDFFAYTQEIGSLAQAGSNALYGLNQTKIPGPAPVNRDTQGFVFFTRPMLNLNKWNLLRNRTFHSLLSNRVDSVQRYVRCTLDPSLADYADPPVTSPLVDNKMVFIPLLSNTILKLSGWPDVVAPTFTSKQGNRKEQWSIIDGTTEVNESFDLDATFTNLADEPASLLFTTWINYGAAVFDGQLRPYAGMEARNEIDYTTRIYRIVMDKSERYIKKIACTIASFPINEPTGKFFDYDRHQQYMDANKELNIRFKCSGAVYNDDIIVKWFNRAATYANPALADVIAAKFTMSDTHTYEAIPHELLGKFKYNGYPLINTETYELQWWIDKGSSIYQAVLNDELGNIVLASGNNPSDNII